MLSITKKVINIFFLVIMSALFIMSLCVHCEMDIYSYMQALTIERHRIPLYLILTLISVMALLLFYNLIDRIMLKVKHQVMAVNAIAAVCAALIFAAGVFWINFNDCVPKYDQAILYKEARKLAGYLHEPFDIKYMTFYKRQRAFTLLMALALRIFGDAKTSVGILNAVGAVAVYLGIWKTVCSLVEDKKYIVFMSVMLAMFYPLVIYTAFMYGTLLSLAFSSWGFYAVVSYCSTAKSKYAVLAAISFPMGILMHQSAAVAAVAGIIYLLAHINKLNAVKNCLVAVSIVIVIFSSLQLANIIYEKLTDAPSGDAVPASTTIYMGLNAETENGGAGSQDGSFTNIFYENNKDAAAANKDALGRIKSIILEYMEGKRSLSFFIRKTEYQWMDPTMGARKAIIANDATIGEPPNSEAFIKFYTGSLRTIIFKMSDIAMILTYGCAAAGGIFTLLCKDDVIEGKSVHFLIQLFFIGGFSFQLMWETLSRYCFPYYVWLIPEALYGMHRIYQLVHKYFKNTLIRTGQFKEDML